MSIWLKRNLIWTEGKWIAIGTILMAIIGWWLWQPITYAATVFLLFSVYFFRNPERVCPAAHGDPDMIVAPADGRVIAIEHDVHNGFDGYLCRVSIFLSIFDVHVNRIPMSGKITRIAYRKGSFKPAFMSKSSHANERNNITINADERTLEVRQIAGIIARRICCWVQEGGHVERGQRYGMIRFGSRVDLLLPANVALYITKGQRVYGGATILGRWLCNQP